MTYYSILGIPAGASKEDIKKAYRRLSLIYHPDVPGGNNAKFIQIKEAYEQLMNKPGTSSQSFNSDYFRNFFRCTFNVVSIKINSKGDAQIYIQVMNVVRIEGLLHLSKGYEWEINGRTQGHIEIKKKDLIACNYIVCLRFHGINGNHVDDVYKIEDKRTFFEKLGDKIKNIFK